MKAITKFLELIYNFKQACYNLRKDYVRYKAEIEIYKKENLKRINESCNK